MHADEVLFDIIHEELSDFFADSVFASESLLMKRASILIAWKIGQTAKGGDRSDIVAARAVEHSLFMHTYFTASDELGNGWEAKGYATTFLNILAGVLVTRSELRILEGVRNILGG
jgi:hypothetical protein